nr:hypothetical protein B0A51_12917 [Rachicladosporium sp. CCFEE 5018]
MDSQAKKIPPAPSVEAEQETGRVSPLGHETPQPKPKVSFQEQDDDNPPPKPPRPTSAQESAEHTLIEAFPSIDAKVVRAVLTASNGQVEPAFNALLGMSDPDFQPEPPAQPPRPTQRVPQTQLEQDEQYARRLAEQYNNQAPRGNQYNQREPGRRAPNQQPRPNERDEQDRSFFDDELPEIGRNIQQGFIDTQKVVNSWITNFKKKIDGEDEEEDLYSGSGRPPQQGRQNFGSSQSEQMYGIRKGANQQRRSVEQQRYDADPHVLGDDEFSRLELRDEEAPPPQPPRTSSRKQANPDLFKPTPAPPQSGPVDEIEAFDRSGRPSTDDKNAKKWQPLTSVQPHPEEDNDPFSLGDDDEGNDKAEDTRKEDTERLKAKARGSVSEPSKPLVESERSGSLGTRNKDAEELLSGKKD